MINHSGSILETLHPINTLDFIITGHSVLIGSALQVKTWRNYEVWSFVVVLEEFDIFYYPVELFSPSNPGERFYEKFDHFVFLEFSCAGDLAYEQILRRYKTIFGGPGRTSLWYMN